MQTDQAMIDRFVAFPGQVETAELLDEEGRPTRDLTRAVEARITKRGEGRVFTVRVDFTRLMEFTA